jgi:hypothetical protein
MLFFWVKIVKLAEYGMESMEKFRGGGEFLSDKIYGGLQSWVGVIEFLGLESPRTAWG